MPGGVLDCQWRGPFLDESVQLQASMPKSTVKLVSAEGFEFIIDYKAACVSNTIRNMLSSQGLWQGSGRHESVPQTHYTHAQVHLRRRSLAKSSFPRSAHTS